MNTKWRNIDIRTLAILVSCALSLWHVLVNPIPNADAFSYVRTADIYLESGVAAAFAWYPSATYPVLMGLVHQVTGIDLFTAGQLINTVFYAIVVYAFISIPLEFRNTQRIALIAAAFILIFPTLNEYRYYLIRDIGFLAFMLLGALHLIRYAKLAKHQHGIAFIVLVFAAALFRSEALAYLALAPIALISRTQNAWQLFIRLEAYLLGLGVGALAFLFILNIDVIDILQRVLTVYGPFLRDALFAMSDGDSDLSVAIFGDYASNFSGQYIWLFMLSGLSAVLLAQLLKGLGVPALLLLFYGLSKHREDLFQKDTRVLLSFTLISFTILLAFLALTRFISTRYTMMFSLSILVLLPLILDNLLTRIEQMQARKLANAAVIFLLTFSAVDAHISFGGSRTSLQSAVDWVLTNTQEGEAFLTNSRYVAYHTGRVEDYDVISRYIEDDVIQNAQYGTILVLMTSSSNDAQIERSVEFQQIEALAAFPNTEEPEVLIYRRLGN
jgi:hypothetical protein